MAKNKKDIKQSQGEKNVNAGKNKKKTETNEPKQKKKEISKETLQNTKKIQKDEKKKIKSNEKMKKNQKKTNPENKKMKKDQNIKNIKKNNEKKEDVLNFKEDITENEEKIDNYNLYITEKLSKLKEIKEKVKEKIILDKKLIKKAVQVLLDINEKNKNPKSILETNEGFIYVEINFNKLPDIFSIRPIQINLPFPIYNEEAQSKFAIIVRDPQRNFKDKIQDMNIPLIAKVIGYTKLIKKYPSYEDKRKLCNSYDYFFCDYKIYDLLRKPTGKFFYARKKIPFPIDIDNIPKHLQNKMNSYEEYLNDLGKYSYFMMGNGPAYTFKPARVSMEIDQIVENIIEGIYDVLPWIIDNGLKTRNVEHIDLKLFNSVSLPIYNYISKKDIKAYLS